MQLGSGIVTMAMAALLLTKVLALLKLSSSASTMSSARILSLWAAINTGEANNCFTGTLAANNSRIFFSPCTK